jgi:hypothetical protein
VLALLHDAPSGAMLAVTNLSAKAYTIDLGPQPMQSGEPLEVFADRDYPPIGTDLNEIKMRLRRTIGGRAGSARAMS